MWSCLLCMTSMLARCVDVMGRLKYIRCLRGALAVKQQQSGMRLIVVWREYSWLGGDYVRSGSCCARGLCFIWERAGQNNVVIAVVVFLRQASRFRGTSASYHVHPLAPACTSPSHHCHHMQCPRFTYMHHHAPSHTPDR